MCSRGPELGQNNSVRNFEAQPRNPAGILSLKRCTFKVQLLVSCRSSKALVNSFSSHFHWKLNKFNLKFSFTHPYLIHGFQHQTYSNRIMFKLKKNALYCSFLAIMEKLSTRWSYMGRFFSGGNLLKNFPRGVNPNFKSQGGSDPPKPPVDHLCLGFKV